LAVFCLGVAAKVLAWIKFSEGFAYARYPREAAQVTSATNPRLMAGLDRIFNNSVSNSMLSCITIAAVRSVRELLDFSILNQDAETVLNRDYS
jgi:hypothetical protein